MKRWTIIALVALAATAGAEPPLVGEARRALAASVPAVAVQKLRAVLVLPSLLPADRAGATLLLAEALLAAGDFTEAQAALAPLDHAGDPTVRILRAHIDAAQSLWAEALEGYQSAAGPDWPVARLGEAESLAALGRTREAAAVLGVLIGVGQGSDAIRLRLASLQLDLGDGKSARATLASLGPGTPPAERERQLLEARLLLLDEQYAPALYSFDELFQNPRHLADRHVAAAALGLATARLNLEGPESADRTLETFIWRYPLSAELDEVFRELDRLYHRQEDAREGELHKWAQKTPPRRAALARFHLARLLLHKGKREKAREALATFVRDFPAHPRIGEACLMQADLALAAQNPADAIRALEAAMRQAKGPALRGAIELRTALVHYQQGEGLLAANLFRSAAERAPALGEAASFNTALARLQQGNFERFLEEYRHLSSLFPESSLRGELVIEHGLVQARSGDPQGAATLRTFLEHFPGHSREGEARLALAEIAFEAAALTAPAGRPAAAEHASQLIQVARQSAGITDEQAAQADCLALTQADAASPAGDLAVIAMAQKFLARWPASVLQPEVRMKLAQIYFRRDDFANAETQFTVLAREQPEGPFAETALFLAAQSALRMIDPTAVDRGLQLLDAVAKRGGALKLYARQEQAIAQGRLGHDEEAIALYDLIISAQPLPSPDLRYAALCGKGDTLLAQGRRTAAKLPAAITVFEQLAAADPPPQWRNQALYKKAQALEVMARLPAALTGYYDVLDRNAAAPAPAREWFWYYKAGFDAARLCEKDNQWRAAIGIFDKMARAAGPRTAEVAERAKRLRLEHFIWE